MQLGVSVMSEFFPKSKAKVTSVYMMMGGLANFLIPLITGYLSTIGLQYIILLDIAFALLAFVTAIIVFIRYYRVFKVPQSDLRLGERFFQ
ncbi:Inner membrane transport protein YdiN [compost metagenome]